MRMWDRTITEAFHRSVCFRYSGLVGTLSDLATHSLSSEPAGSLRLYISDSPPGLAFLHDPILLESPEATYVVEWNEAKASQKSKAYIMTAKEKHAKLHTFMYTLRKVCHPLLVHLSVKWLVVTTFPCPLNRAFGIILGSGVGAGPISRLRISRTGTYSFPPLPAPETHAVTCLLGSTHCCTLIRS